MCYLRGLCFAKHNAFDRAKECYKDAVRIDIQCFEAFDQLVKNALMSPGEEWDFLDSLNFESVQQDSGTADIVPEAADFVRNLYSTRLSKYTHPEVFNTAIETLSTHYKLGQNADILLARAEILFTCSRFQDALDLTSQILKTDPYNFACMPLHLALLHQLDHQHALFALAHDLADTHPEIPCTWLAVGTYYYAKDRIPEARSYFSKASLMDPHFGAAWIGFAHTFAAEGESDQAIAAYSTAARLFQGTHLPQMFLGMQELVLGNITIAREFLTAAYNVCDRDPLLINEIGVATFHEENYESAVRHFVYALEIAKENNAPAYHYAGTRLNLSHALRRSGRFEEALHEVEEVIRLGMCEADVFTTKGLTLLELDRTFDAVTAFHEALAISPQHPMASDLLNKALKQLTEESGDVLGGADEDDLEEALRRKLDERRALRNPFGGVPRAHQHPLGLSDPSAGPSGAGGGRANRLARQAAGLSARSGDHGRRPTP
jgi:anaphase-promoting complex subunit 6